MAKKKLIHPALWTAPLAENAANTTIELSAADSAILNNYRLAMGGEVRILIYKPATYDSATAYYETVLIDSAPTANVFTVAAMTSEAQYTTANSAVVAINLIADGNMEWYKTSAWANSAAIKASYKNINNSFSGKQSLKLRGTALFSYTLQTVLASIGENFYFTCNTKAISQNSLLNILNGADSVTYKTNQTSSTSFEKVSAGFKTTTAANIHAYIYAHGSTALTVFDNIIIIQNMFSDPGFEDTADWGVTNAAHATDSSNEKSGTNCGKVIASAAKGYVYQDITVTDSTYYTCVFHGKATAGDSYKYQAIGNTTGKTYFESDTQTGTSYKEIRCQFKTSGDTSVQLRGVVVGNGDIIYFDDWSMVPLISITLDYDRVYSGTTVVAAESGYYGAYSDSVTYEVTQGNCKVYVSTIEGSYGDITLNYTLEDDRENNASIKPQYAFTSNGTYYDMTSAGGDDGVNNLTTSAAGTAHDFIWSTVSDLGSDFKGKVFLRILAYDHVDYKSDYNASESIALAVDNAPEAPTISAPTTNYFAKDEIIQIVGTIPDPKVVSSDMHVRVEFASDAGFGDIVKIYESNLDQTGWEYDTTGDEDYTAIPKTGIPTNSTPALEGNNWRLTIQTEDRLSPGIFYIRAQMFGLNN